MCCPGLIGAASKWTLYVNVDIAWWSHACVIIWPWLPFSLSALSAGGWIYSQRNHTLANWRWRWSFIHGTICQMADSSQSFPVMLTILDAPPPPQTTTTTLPLRSLFSLLPLSTNKVLFPPLALAPAEPSSSSRRQAANFSVARSTVERSRIRSALGGERLLPEWKSGKHKVVVETLNQCQFIPTLQIRISERLDFFRFGSDGLTARSAFCVSRRRTKRHTNCGLCSGFTNAANVFEFAQRFVSFGFRTLKHYSLPLLPSWQENNFQNQTKHC